MERRRVVQPSPTRRDTVLLSAVARVPVHTREEARVHGGPSALAYSAASGNPSSLEMLGREVREPLPCITARRGLSAPPPPLQPL